MTNIHPHPWLSFDDVTRLQADHGLVLQRNKGARLTFRHQPKALTYPGLQRLSAALKQRASPMSGAAQQTPTTAPHQATKLSPGQQPDTIGMRAWHAQRRQTGQTNDIYDPYTDDSCAACAIVRWVAISLIGIASTITYLVM